MARGRRVVAVGVAAVALALIGWIATLLAVSFAQQPDATEDLTSVWRQAGPTRLGDSTAVAVPPGQTLVAFLVGTDLYGTAGTTTGTCTATSGGSPVELGWPVHVNPALTGILENGRQTVAIGGWTNNTGRAAQVEIRCTTADSTVDHYVAVPTRTAVVTRNPWFQPGVWVAMAGAGVALIVAGARRVNPPSR